MNVPAFHAARAQAHIAGLQQELEALEGALLHPPAWAARLKGQRLVYVGGRPRSNAALRSMVQQAGGEFVLHAGLIDDDGRPSRFASLLAGADLVCCALDLIDHDSLAALRRLCARHGVPWRPLRSASVASFVAALSRDGLPPSVAAPAGTGPRACLRHG